MKKVFAVFTALVLLLCLSACLKLQPERSHSHIYAETVLDSSCTERGSKTYTCACGDSYSQPTPKAAHSYDENMRCTACGSHASTGLEFSLNSDDSGPYYAVTGIGSCNDKTVRIPGSYQGLPVRSIGGEAFANCSRFQSVELPDTVTAIHTRAFMDCSGLKDINIPSDSVVRIGDFAFAGSGLTEIILPDGLNEVGSGAFQKCYGLKQVTISNGDVEIGENAFDRCSGLNSIRIPEGIRKIENAVFYSCTGLKEVILPDSLQGIGEYAFWGCTGLTEVKIPDRVHYVDAYAFRGCKGLTHISLPSELSSIGQYAFCGCESLTQIQFRGTKAEWNGFLKEHSWNENTGEYRVRCTDGTTRK